MIQCQHGSEVRYVVVDGQGRSQAGCRECSRARYYARDERCAVRECRVPLDGHWQCKECTILVGPGHLEDEMRGDVCVTCWEYAQEHPMPVVALKRRR